MRCRLSGRGAGVRGAGCRSAVPTQADARLRGRLRDGRARRSRLHGLRADAWRLRGGFERVFAGASRCRQEGEPGCQPGCTALGRVGRGAITAPSTSPSGQRSSSLQAATRAMRRRGFRRETRGRGLAGVFGAGGARTGTERNGPTTTLEGEKGAGLRLGAQRALALWALDLRERAGIATGLCRDDAPQAARRAMSRRGTLAARARVRLDAWRPGAGSAAEAGVRSAGRVRPCGAGG